MAEQGEIDLDSIIDRLLEVRGSRPGKQVQLLEAEIRHLCTKAREIFISQPILLELEAPIKVCLLYFPFPHVPSAPLTLKGRFAAIFTDSTMICFACSNMAASLPRPIIYSSATT